MNKKTYDAIEMEGFLAIKQIKKDRDNKLKEIVEDLKNSGIHTSFVVGNRSISKFLMIISINNNNFLKDSSRYKINITPTLESRRINGSDKVGIKFVCVSCCCNIAVKD